MLLVAALAFGLLSSWAFLYPEYYNRFLPFYQLRPFHVSAALFWIISGASACVLSFRPQPLAANRLITFAERFFVTVWLLTILVIFVCYGLRKFGGREYWEFPPVLGAPLLLSWLALMAAYFIPLLKNTSPRPLYAWMWSTGIFFFLLTFIEQNLWLIPWFRTSYLRELTIQWKANGATVGAWNQMIYGTSLFLMVKISGNENLAKGKTAFFFYLLGLTNLMFNWGHHIYNAPIAPWIRNTSYIISMTEWIFLIRMIASFRKTLEDQRKFRHLVTYRCIVAAEGWVFLNLLLALAMSVPAINRYTHGTHITVAHAMGTTIGINTMILLGGISYLLNFDRNKQRFGRLVTTCLRISQVSLFGFWMSLIAAGSIKAYMATVRNLNDFSGIMKPVMPALQAFSVMGIGVTASLSVIAFVFIAGLLRLRNN